MDQSASVLSEKGSALHVSFAPRLSARPIAFPPTSPELTFLIAQSFVTSNKHVTGPIHYNLRVVEVSLAAAYLHAVLNPPGSPPLPEDAGPLGISLHGFHEAYFFHKNKDSDNSAGKSLTQEQELEKLISITTETLTKEEGYTREEIASVLNISVPELEKRFMSTFPVRADTFKLRQRALHVYTEALRVLQFLSLLSSSTSNESSGTDTTPLNTALGSLMNQTQTSCRDLYECSCSELDRICEISKAAGAYAARLTGAGWGGCTVHLVPADKVDDVKAALEKEYYSTLELTEEQRAEAVVVSRPATGAAIYKVEGGQVR